jgi:hypothetical protein
LAKRSFAQKPVLQILAQLVLVAFVPLATLESTQDTRSAKGLPAPLDQLLQWRQVEM